MRPVFVVTLIALVSIVVAPTALQAAAFTGPIYGFNYEWLRDADGDGIPNHLDDDWVPPLDGTGYKMMHGALAAFFFVVDVPFSRLPSADEDRTQDRIRLQDGTRDRTHLHLRDGTCQ